MNKWDLQKKNVKKNGKKKLQTSFLMFGVVGVCCNCVEIVEIFFRCCCWWWWWLVFIYFFFFLLFQQYLRHVKYILLEVCLPSSIISNSYHFSIY